uniref:PTTG1 interacting protein n=1 Tax=Cyprinodon variegatus TaxID=28743 RepID=A0A3Q2DTW7_CYPVA
HREILTHIQVLNSYSGPSVVVFLLSNIKTRPNSGPGPNSDPGSCPNSGPGPISCLWCFATNSCSEYPVTWLLPPASLCPLSQARWGVCWVNFEALIIAMAVVLGTIIISIIICCCCCCCRRRTRPAGPDRDEETFSRRREEIRQRA